MKAYRITPTKDGYAVVEREEGDVVADGLDKRTAMRLAYTYTRNGVPDAPKPKSTRKRKQVRKVQKDSS